MVSNAGQSSPNPKERLSQPSKLFWLYHSGLNFLSTLFPRLISQSNACLFVAGMRKSTSKYTLNDVVVLWQTCFSHASLSAKWNMSQVFTKQFSFFKFFENCDLPWVVGSHLGTKQITSRKFQNESINCQVWCEQIQSRFSGSKVMTQVSHTFNSIFSFSFAFTCLVSGIFGIRGSDWLLGWFARYDSAMVKPKSQNRDLPVRKTTSITPRTTILPLAGG